MKICNSQHQPARPIQLLAILALAALFFVAVSCQSVSAASGVTTTISPSPGNTAYGTATLQAGPAANQFTIKVTMDGLPPGPHPEHIHVGTCPLPGAIAFSLPTLQPDPSGHATATATINAPLSTVTDGNHAVNVHQANMTPIACGTIPRGNG